MKKLVCKVLCSLILLGGIWCASPIHVSAKATYDVTYETKNQWDTGYEGELQISNNGAAPLEYWTLEFDLAEEITGIWGGKILSHSDNHYVITYENWNSIIEAGKTVNLGYIVNSEENASTPNNITVTDILDSLEKQDLEWQNYTNYMDYMNIQKSFADFFYYYYTRFESPNPHKLGYEVIEKNPVEKFTTSEYEDITFHTKDGLTLKGLFFPVANAKGTLVVLHGRATNMQWTIQNIQFLIDNGYQVLLYNARFWNYCNTPEAYQTASFSCDIEDVQCAAQYLKTRSDVDMVKIGVYGFSNGANKGIVAGALYDEFKVLMLDGASSFPFFKENDGVCSNTLPSNWFELRDSVIDLFSEKFNITSDTMKEYDYDIRMDELTKPVLLLQGMNDPYVTLAETQYYYDAANGPKEMYTYANSSHCDAVFSKDKDKYIEDVLTFLSIYLN